MFEIRRSVEYKPSHADGATILDRGALRMMAPQPPDVRFAYASSTTPGVPCVYNCSR